MEGKGSAAVGGAGFRLAGFPKEFERNFWETLDKRYYSILLITFLIVYGWVFYVANQEWVLSEEQISQLKKRIIEKVYDVEIITPPEGELTEEEGAGGELITEEAPEPEEVSEKGKQRVEESQTQRQQRRRQTQAELQRRSQQMQAEVARQGILAIATGAGGSGSGNVAYEDVLQDVTSGAGGVGDIGEIVEGTSGIRTAGAPGERTRAAKGSGARTEGGATGIDDLISGGSVTEGGSFERRGKIELKTENVQFTKGTGSRDPEAITAAINRQSGLVEYCYQRRAKLNPNLRGRIDMEIVIEPTGKVSSARIYKSTIKDKRLEDCIVKNVKKWRFGKANGGLVKIRVPFIF
ncbi:MAG: hypothetical protein D6748_02610 [Calditrichaeota bacterium]|nr:MAG: hypothetical protein D6748_02610 [Calditrichota bacterium]